MEADDDTTTFTPSGMGVGGLDLLDEQPPDFPSPSMQEDDDSSQKDPRSEAMDQIDAGSEDDDDVTIFRSAAKLKKNLSSTANIDKTPAQGGGASRRSPRKKASLPSMGMPTDPPTLATPMPSRRRDPQHPDNQAEDDDDDTPTRESQLIAERDRLQTINSYLEQTIQSMQIGLEKAKGLSSTVDTTHALMDTYTKILSQMTHTSELLLNKDWEQAKDDEVFAQRLAKQREEEDRRAKNEREAAAAAARAAQQTLLQLDPKDESSPIIERGLSRGLRGRSRIAQTRGSSTRGGTRGRGSNPSAIPTPSISTSSSSSVPKGPRGSGTVTGVRAQRGLKSRVITRKPRGA